MSDTSLYYYNEQLLKVNPRILRLVYNITGAKAASPVVSNSASFVFFDALTSQSQIDSVLETSSEFAFSLFGATAMGADAFAGVVNMGGQTGQCKQVVQMIARCYSGTGGATLVTRQTQSLAIANVLQTAVQVGSSGNLAFQVDFGNTPDFDALTSGTIEIEIHWISK